MRGVFLDLGTVSRNDLDLRALQSTLPEWSLFEKTAADTVIPAIQGATIVVSNKVVLDRDTLQSNTALKLICVAATGTNNVDLEAARDRNITVCNVRAYATASVVEHVFAQILTLTRRLEEYRDAVMRGDWQRADGFCLLDYPIRELAGQTLGIIGHGELGSAVARMAEAFGMHVLVARRPGTPAQPGRTPLDALLERSTVVSLHCPLTDATRNLIDSRELGLMRRDAILINTARGGIVNEPALCRALQAGEIAGAAVDVLSDEPPRAGNPLLELSLPNLLVTPHIAWSAVNARQRLIDEIATNIRAYLDGSPRNTVQG
jgi:glycerate dehydrogenase